MIVQAIAWGYSLKGLLNGYKMVQLWPNGKCFRAFIKDTCKVARIPYYRATQQEAGVAQG